MLRAKLREEDEALETEREAHRLEVQRLREELEDVQVACGNGKLAGCLHEEEDLHGRFSRTSDSLAAQLGGAASSQESDEEEPRVEHRGSGVLPAEFARVQDELRKQTAAAEVAQRECLLLREQLGDAEALKLEFVRLQERLAVADGIRCECVQLQEQLAAAELAQWEAAHLPEQLAIGAAQSESAELRTKLDSAQRECQRLRKQVSFTDQIKRQNTLLREQQRTVHATQRRLAQWHDEPAIGEPSSDEVQQSERAQPRGHAGVAEEAEPRHVEVRERLVVEQIQQCGVQLQAQPIGVGACQQTSLELQERTAAASREHSECAQLREQLSAYAGVCEEQLRSHLAEQEATRHLCVELREQLTGTEDAQLQCEQLREQLAAAEQVKLECAQLQQQLAIAERAQHGCVYLRKQLELVEGEHGECKLLQDQCSAHEGSRRPRRAVGRREACSVARAIRHCKGGTNCCHPGRQSGVCQAAAAASCCRRRSWALLRPSGCRGGRASVCRAAGAAGCCQGSAAELRAAARAPPRGRGRVPGVRELASTAGPCRGHRAHSRARGAHTWGCGGGGRGSCASTSLGCSASWTRPAGLPCKPAWLRHAPAGTAF